MSTNMLRFILLRIPKRTKEHDSARSQRLHSDRLSTAQRSAPRQDRGSLWTLYRAVHRGKSDFVRSMTAKAELLGMNAALLTEVHVPSPQYTKAKLLLIGREEPEIDPLPEETRRQNVSMRRSTAPGLRLMWFLGMQRPTSMCCPLTARASAIPCWKRVP